jgi:predicted nucleic acid-binding protein
VQIDFHRGVALRARQYAQQHGLKNYDAIHLASAVDASADVLMTTDKGFPIGQSVDGVWVDQPYAPGDEPIPGL